MKTTVQGNIPEEIVLIQAAKMKISRQLEEGKQEEIEVTPVFISDAGNTKTIATGVQWASGKKYTYSYSSHSTTAGHVPVQETQKNLPNSGYRIFSLETRSEGGRAYKVVSPHGYYFDLREDVLLDTMLNAGINKNGLLNGEFIFAKVGSQMKLIRYGSNLHKAIERTMIRAANKILDAQLKFGHMYEDLRGYRSIFLGFFNSVNVNLKTQYNYARGSGSPARIVTGKTCTIRGKNMLWLTKYAYTTENLSKLDPLDDLNIVAFEFKKSQAMVEDLGDFSKHLDLEKIKNDLIVKMDSELLHVNNLKEEILTRYAPFLSIAPVGKKPKLPQIFNNFWNGPIIDWDDK